MAPNQSKSAGAPPAKQQRQSGLVGHQPAAALPKPRGRPPKSGARPSIGEGAAQALAATEMLNNIMGAQKQEQHGKEEAQKEDLLRRRRPLAP